MSRSLTSRPATARHEQLRGELLGLIESYGDLSAPQILALASQIVGNLIALQDQRTMTPGHAMEIVMANIQEGNAAIVEGLLNPAGAA